MSKTEVGGKLPVVLVHGWGLGSSIWSSVLPLLTAQRDVYTVDMSGYLSADVSDEVANLPEAYILLGFSLGGIVSSTDSTMLANAKGLITVSTNAQFLASQDWSSAMPALVFKNFSEAFKGKVTEHNEQTTAALKTFTGLQCKGSPSMRSETRYLRAKQDDAHRPDVETLASGLLVLSETDLRDDWAQLNIPSLHQFGCYDQLVPVSAANEIEKTLDLDVEIFDNSAHQPFLSEPDIWVSSINRFVSEQVGDL